MAPISNTEIAFLRFDPKQDPNFPERPKPKASGGVAIYDVVNNTITNVADHPGFLFNTSFGCVKSGYNQITAIVSE